MCIYMYNIFLLALLASIRFFCYTIRDVKQKCVHLLRLFVQYYTYNTICNKKIVRADF